MRQIVAVLVLLFLVFSCKKKAKQEEKDPMEKQVEQFEKKIEKRPDFETPKAMTLADTTDVAFSSVFVTTNQERIKKETQEFYKRTNYKTRWIYSDKKDVLLQSFLEALQASKEYGFNPETYNYTLLRDQEELLKQGQLNDTEIEALDKQATASFLLFAIHLSEGRIANPEFGDHIWRKAPDQTDEVDLLAKLNTKDDLGIAVASLHPHNPQYVRMQERLKEIRTKNDTLEYTQFSFGSLRNFKPEYKNEKILLLRENLAKRGFPTDTLSNKVDSNLILTIKKFQDDRNITSDGLPGENTLYYLNMTPEQEEKLLILNMERARWIDREKLKGEYIIVNIPEYKLFMFKDDKFQFEMNVVVGTQYTPTPVFSDNMEYIEFRPTWTVPQSIIRGEMIPMMKADPTRYTRSGFRIFENGSEIDPLAVDWNSPDINKRFFVFVEKPSRSNALGLVKFIFPNNLSIYLHDTPTRHFNKNKRALSHGCVRVAEPAKLATFLLEDKPEWNLEKVKEAMSEEGEEKQRVYLEKDVFVQLIYITAYVNENNKLVLSNDVYGFDQEHLKILEQFN